MYQSVGFWTPPRGFQTSVITCVTWDLAWTDLPPQNIAEQMQIKNSTTCICLCRISSRCRMYVHVTWRECPWRIERYCIHVGEWLYLFSPEIGNQEERYLFHPPFRSVPLPENSFGVKLLVAFPWLISFKPVDKMFMVNKSHTTKETWIENRGLFSANLLGSGSFDRFWFSEPTNNIKRDKTLVIELKFFLKLPLRV